MGNEVSSVQIHSLLTAQDIKALRDNFPGGGNGEPPTRLDWGAWGAAWPEPERAAMERILRAEVKKEKEKAVEGPEGAITFHAYQEMAGNAVRGNCEDRVKLLFRLLDRPSDKTLPAGEVRGFVSRVVLAAANAMAPGCGKDRWAEDAEVMANGLVQELVAPGGNAKTALREDPKDDIHLDFDMIERWLVMKCPLFEEIYIFALAMSFGISVSSSSGTGVRKPPLFPLDGLSFPTSSSNGGGGDSDAALHPGHETSLTPADVIFLNHHVPAEARTKWRCLFNSRVHGENFARMSAGMLNKGPTVLIVWEKNGHKFGGYAGASWGLSPKFYGPNTCFLFSLTPKKLTYETTTFNGNYMYMNLKQKTLPNGIGMGGQFDFFGLWLDNEYGQGRCAPSCTSYQSPQLSKEENFQFVHVEVWGVGEEPKTDSDDEDGGGGRSALDLDPEAQAVMEMMGKTFVSKDVKAADAQVAKERSLKEKQQNGDK